MATGDKPTGEQTSTEQSTLGKKKQLLAAFAAKRQRLAPEEIQALNLQTRAAAVALRPIVLSDADPTDPVVIFDRDPGDKVVIIDV